MQHKTNQLFPNQRSAQIRMKSKNNIRTYFLLTAKCIRGIFRVCTLSYELDSMNLLRKSRNLIRPPICMKLYFKVEIANEKQVERPKKIIQTFLLWAHFTVSSFSVNEIREVVHRI